MSTLAEYAAGTDSPGIKPQKRITLSDYAAGTDILPLAPEAPPESLFQIPKIEPAVADVTARGELEPATLSEWPGLIPKGMLTKYIPKITGEHPSLAPGLPGKRVLESPGLETVRRVAHNLAIGVPEWVLGITAGTLEDPVGTVKGLITFYPELAKTVSTALGLEVDVLRSVGGFPAMRPVSEEEQRKAVQHIGENPIEVVLALLPAIKGLRGLRGLRGEKAKAGEVKPEVPREEAVAETKAAVEPKAEIPAEPIRAEASPIEPVTQAISEAPGVPAAARTEITPTELSPVEKAAQKAPEAIEARTVTPKATEQPPVQRAYELRPDEWVKQQERTYQEIQGFGDKKGILKRKAVSLRMHKEAVEMAIDKGRVLRPEVLKPYPDLWERYEKVQKARAEGEKYYVDKVPGQEPQPPDLVSHFRDQIAKGEPRKKGLPLVVQARIVDKSLSRSKDYGRIRDSYDMALSMEAKEGTLPKALGGGKDTPVSIGEIRDYVSEAFEVPLRIGKYRKQTGAGTRAGIYKKKQEVIRTAEYEDLESLSHEVAHHIDKKYGLDKMYADSKELSGLDYDLKAARPSEGFAEYIRHYVTGSADPKAVAPEFTKRFEVYLAEPAQKGLRARLENFQSMVAKWREQGAEARIQASMVSKTKSKWKGMEEAVDSVRTRLFDTLDPLRRLEKEVESKLGRRLRGEESAFQMATALKHKAATKAAGWISDATFDFDGNITGQGLRSILEPVKGKELEAVQYAYCKHAIERWGQGKNPGIDLADAQYYVNKHNYPEFETFAKELAGYRGRLLDYVVDSGGFDPAVAKKFREIYEYAVPLYRTGFERGGAGGGRGFADLPTPVKRAKGSGREVINPLAGLVQETERLISWADRARVGTKIIENIEAVEGMGKWGEKVTLPAKAQHHTVPDILKKLEDIGAEVKLDQAARDKVLTFWTHETHGIPKDNVVTFFRDGKLEAWQLHPDLYRAVKDMDHMYVPPLLRLLTYPKKVLVAGATGFRASFGVLTNPIRDLQTYFMQSIHKRSTPFDPTLLGGPQVLKQKLGLKPAPETALWFRQGGEYANFFNAEVPRAMQTARAIMADNKKMKALGIVSHPIDLYRQVINIPEATGRAVEFRRTYQKVLRETGSHRSAWIEGMNAAGNVTLNFSRSGYISQAINQFIPFFNPAMQDWSVVARNFRRNPTRTIIRGLGSLTIPTLYLWYQNKDKDWYRALPEWRKVTCWNFDVGGEVVSLPKPFLWGATFAATPEGFIDAAYRKDPSIAKDMVFQAFETQLPVSSFPDLLGAFKPTYEVIAGETGHDWFRDRDIVSHYEVEKLPPREQYGRFTTETSKYIGGVLNISPKKIDHWLSGTTGGMATDVIKVIEGTVMPKPGRKLTAGTPIVGRLFNYPPFLSYYYRELQEFRDKAKEHNLKTDLGEKEKQDLYRLAQLEAYGKVLSGIRRSIVGVNKDKMMSFARKQEQIEELETLSEDIAHEAIFGKNSPESKRDRK